LQSFDIRQIENIQFTTPVKKYITARSLTSQWHK